jgi:hypothetical protein
VSYVLHYTAPLVQVPPRGLWGKSSAPKVTTLEAWLGKTMLKPAPDKLALRYLRAYGPASVADARAWSGVANLAPVFERLRSRLVTFRDERGTELFDVPDGLRPAEDTPAPPRFLPVYDNVTLGFANRDRIIRQGPSKPPPDNAWVRSFLLDGFVAGFWKIVEDKKSATLTVQPFGKLSRRDKMALAEEGRALLGFAAPARKHAVAFAAADGRGAATYPSHSAPGKRRRSF